LWLNLITDVAPALAPGLEKGDLNIMVEKLRSKTESIINHTMVWGLFFQTIVQTSVVLIAFVLGFLNHLESSAIVPGGNQPNPLSYRT
jgi:Ca2+-transporting ATPase